MVYMVGADIAKSGNSISVFEEYTGQEALNAHFKGKAFTSMVEAWEKEGLLDVSCSHDLLDI
jgi:quinol monooxygenase YgiN